MNQEFMDPEIFSDFIIEAKEHLETIEPNLLELESNPEDLDLLNEIFRPMHSLKGASGFLGLDKINMVAHRAENVLDELRKGKMKTTSHIMDVILNATDVLRTMIENLETEESEGDVDISPIVGKLDALMKEQAGGASASAPEAASAQPAAPVSAAPAPSAPEAEAAGDLAVAERPEPENSPVAESLEAYALSVSTHEHLTDFVEEAQEIVQNLNQSLLGLEQLDEPQETVNDIFRYFHNLKGNSGIVGYSELNALTHEAESLLNKVRHKDIAVSHELVDLLLQVADVIESLVNGVNIESGEVTPVGTAELLARLQLASQTGTVTAQEAPVAKSESAAQGGKAEDVLSETEESGLDGVDPEDVKIFLDTVRQQQEAIHLALVELEKDSGQQNYVDALYRSLVTVQNSTGYMGFDDISLNAKRTAGLVDQARNSDMDFGLMIDILKQECSIISDQIKATVEVLKVQFEKAEEEAAAPEPATSAPVVDESPVLKETAESAQSAQPSAETASPAKDEAPAPEAAKKPAKKAGKKPVESSKRNKAKISTIRVDHDKLDHLMNLIGELIINRNRFAMLARHLEEGGEQLDIQDVASNLTETTYAMARISDDLQDTIMKVRMMPVKTVFTRFPRLVRDLSRKSQKAVELITEGEETEMDKSVIEEIGDPLVHLLRNAVDHGLEPPEERLRLGKPETGRVWLRAYHAGNSVNIEVQDDGRGIDPQRMREVGVRKGIVTEEEAKNLDDQQAIELIFAPGFSGAEKVTDISGRGVGMDVVKTNIKNLKGSININTEIGKGTCFTLSLPLTLAIIDALMVTVSGQTYAIPLESVSETTKLDADILTEVNGRKAVTMRDEVLGIMELSEILELDPNLEEREQLPVVVIQDGNRRLGLIVDSLLERQEIVIKPLGAYLGDKEGISGATIMGDGSVVLILDPHEIYRMSMRVI
ncbi:chemotaxis protein CheA [Desulfobaculum bizertense]|uniref:Chemotaxis protein CheA n=1 Tax=Desulfobaculum bizertense DSM 18034 TaxID=1121442 RepID=A0A1T4WIE1_9BACT|nr:chemotaxis protein CheA [Desulfobaculum bizertense]SKA76421.1 two-component system, chemotaxis family, sensor kinase CheA [Desulfobaculum bizertense DSM 18034]